MDPACKVALITGGTRGIGFAIASQLLKAGAKNVAITGLDGCTGRDAVHKLNGTFGKKKAMFIGSSVTCMIQLEGKNYSIVLIFLISLNKPLHYIFTTLN